MLVIGFILFLRKLVMNLNFLVNGKKITWLHSVPNFESGRWGKKSSKHLCQMAQAMGERGWEVGALMPSLGYCTQYSIRPRYGPDTVLSIVSRQPQLVTPKGGVQYPARSLVNPELTAGVGLGWILCTVHYPRPCPAAWTIGAFFKN
jgi:hypothetical protein